MKSTSFASLLAATAMALIAGSATANDIPFTGFFSNDSEHQLFSFNVGSGGATVTLETISYAGGGFDPSLALWDNTGHILAQNDDKDNANSVYDSYLNIALGEGTFWLAIIESGNFINGTANGYYDPNSLDNGFTGCQICGGPGSGGVYAPNQWVVNINNVVSAQTENAFTPTSPPPPLPLQPGQVPEPGTAALLGIGLLGLSRKKLKLAWFH